MGHLGSPLGEHLYTVPTECQWSGVRQSETTCCFGGAPRFGVTVKTGLETLWVAGTQTGYWLFATHPTLGEPIGSQRRLVCGVVTLRFLRSRDRDLGAFKENPGLRKWSSQQRVGSPGDARQHTESQAMCTRLCVGQNLVTSTQAEFSDPPREAVLCP